MKLWRRRRQIEARELSSFISAGLVRLNQKLLQAAGYLQRKTDPYSNRKKKVLLAILLLLFAGGSTFVLLQSITAKHLSPVVVTGIKRVQTEKPKKALPISKGTFLKVKAFQHYVDSLGQTERGKRLRDSFLRLRPHLMDSVHFLVNLYQEQTKKQ